MAKTITTKKILKGKALLLPAIMGAVLCMPAPLRSANESHVYGFLGYYQPKDEHDFQAGWYRINTADGSEKKIWDDQKFGITGTYFNTGYTRNNKLCGYYGNTSGFFYFEFDLANGVTVLDEEIDASGENAFRKFFSGAYNRADDCVYGFSLNVDRTKEYIIKVPASDPKNIEIIGEVPENFLIPVSCCFSPTDNHLYGIDQLGDLIRMDIYGNFEWVGAFTEMSGETTPNIAGWESGMVYSPRDKAFIWNRQASTFESWLYKIDATTLKWSKITALDWADQYTILECTDTDGDDLGPAAPERVSRNFTGAASEGSITFRMPKFLADGNAAPASMKWVATDGKNTQEGAAAPGHEVTVNYTDLANGEHNFTFRAFAGDKRGASLVENFWVGYDTPKRPTNVQLTPLEEDGKFQLSWTAPTEGAHASYVDPSALKYDVTLDGEIVKAGISECTTTVTLPTDAETRRYSFQVTAIADGMTSEPARSNYVFTGRGYGVPLYITPTQEQAENMTVINVDGDKSNWHYTVEAGIKTPAFFTGKDWDNKGNDWLITTPLWLDDTSKKYQIDFEVKFHNTLKAEEFYEVWLGTAPTVDDIRTQRVAPKTRVNSNSYYTSKYTFEIGEPGTYYLGIRYVGDADQGGIYVRNINITKTNEPSVGIEDIPESEDIGVSGDNGCIRISSDKALSAEVYGADGRLVARPAVHGVCTLPMAKGVYIVKAGTATHKIFVK